jgi:NAD(P)-dependent dehydrogenase (short-subunit alcohol dehydrogenase family)
MKALVIGGSGTVGRALCRALAADGARVAFTYRDGGEVAERLAEEGMLGRRLDLTDAAALAPTLRELAAELGGLDALVHCAVRSSTAPAATFDRLEDVTSPGWDELMAVNVRSAFFACQALAPSFGAGGGNIVLLGSIDGIKPVPSPTPYAVSKAALHGMVLSLAKALGGRQIRVNLVAPGILDEGVSRTLPADLRDEYLRHAGLRRFGAVSEVTGVASWFALHNRYVTGQTIILDGGL